MFRVNVTGAQESFRHIHDDLLAAARQALGQAVSQALALARSTDTFQDRTGALRGSIVRGQSGTWSLFVKAGSRGVRYASVVEFGSKPHTIAARGGGVLAFMQGGSMRFARSVRHPGTKPTHFMQSARDRAEQDLVRFVEIGANRAVRGR